MNNNFTIIKGKSVNYNFERLWLICLISLILCSNVVRLRAQVFTQNFVNQVKRNATRNSLTGINSWAYQLQDMNITEIAANNTFELIVMDYSKDGTDEEKFTSIEISQIKNSGKKAISYISIGEAENYRFYWDENWDADTNGVPDPGAPEWLGNVNPNWDGNYKVRFWHSEWQNIIFSYINTIYSQGFDGIYMDIIDAYYYWMEENPEEPQAASLMIQFILNIREYINGLTDSDFYLIPQNGEYIIEEMCAIDSIRKTYRNASDDLKISFFNAIDGIGAEDLFFIGDEDENNIFNPDTGRIRILQEFLAHDKQVFSVEYLTDNKLIQQYITEVEQQNFVPYVTTRELGTLHDGMFLSVEKNEQQIPQSCILFQNYPNPFNAQTTISYKLSKSGHTNISIYNVVGQVIEIIVNEYNDAGPHVLSWNANEITSGLYFYKITTGEFSEVKKCVVLK